MLLTPGGFRLKGSLDAMLKAGEKREMQIPEIAANTMPSHHFLSPALIALRQHPARIVMKGGKHFQAHVQRNDTDTRVAGCISHFGRR